MHQAAGRRLYSALHPSLSASFCPHSSYFSSSSSHFSCRCTSSFCLPSLSSSPSPLFILQYILHACSCLSLFLYVSLSYPFLNLFCCSFIFFLFNSSSPPFFPPRLPPGPAGVTEAAKCSSVLPAADAAAADQQRTAAEPGSRATGKGVCMSCFQNSKFCLLICRILYQVHFNHPSDNNKGRQVCTKKKQRVIYSTV